MTQKEMIVKYIQDFGSISTYEAFVDLGIARLASRICDLNNDGYAIEKKRLSKPKTDTAKACITHDIE